MSRVEPAKGPLGATPSGKACLCLLGAGAVVTESWHLSSRPMTFGRGATADSFVDDESLSRNHFLITHEGNEYFVIDLDSQNGTWVQGDRVTAHKLKHGDVIRAGQSIFCFTNPEARSPGPIRVTLPPAKASGEPPRAAPPN